jgi:type I site-specific restriction endonuclease
MSPSGSKNAPEAKAREKIDVLLAQSGWLVQDREDMNVTASDAIAVREFKLEKSYGYVDYLLFVDGNAIGVAEANRSRSGSRSSRKPSKDVRDSLGRRTCRRSGLCPRRIARLPRLRMDCRTTPRRTMSSRRPSTETSPTAGSR